MVGNFEGRTVVLVTKSIYYHNWMVIWNVPLNDVLIYYYKLLCHSKTTNVYKNAQCLFISGSRTMLTRRLAKVVITTRIVAALAPKYYVSLTFDNLT